MSRQLAIIGCGNMGGALLRGVLQSGLHEADELLIYHPRANSAATLESEFGVEATTEWDDLVNYPRYLLAVKPAKLAEVLPPLGELLLGGELIVSVAAGKSLATLRKLLDNDQASLIRAMPNTPVQVQAGITAWAASENTTAEQRDYAECFFEAVGQSVEVEESQLDAYTALCGSGPAYVFLILEALADAAVRQGIPRAKAESLAASLLQGSAKLAAESGHSAASLRAAVTSPGGTTAEGLAQLEAHGLRAAFLSCLQAATARSRELDG